jgi:hypothetical protein
VRVGAGAEPPRKAIALAVFLLLVGTLFLSLGVLALQGKLPAEKGTPRELARAAARRGHASGRAALAGHPRCRASA